MLFCPPVAPFGFSPLAIQNRPQGGDSAHFAKHWSKLSRNVHLSKINGIISLKQKSPTSRLKCLVCTLTKTRPALLFVRYGHGHTCFLTQQYVSVLRNVSTQLLVEVGKPKITYLYCTPPIHRPLHLLPLFMHGCWTLNWKQGWKSTKDDLSKLELEVG